MRIHPVYYVTQLISNKCTSFLAKHSLKSIGQSLQLTCAGKGLPLAVAEIVRNLSIGAGSGVATDLLLSSLFTGLSGSV